MQDVATYADPSAIASDSNVDIVAVSVNVPEHFDLTKPALEAGKDVFVEWPLARNLSEAEELTQLAKKRGVKTMIGLQARQNPSILKAKEIVESGKLGKILTSTLSLVPLYTRAFCTVCQSKLGRICLPFPSDTPWMLYATFLAKSKTSQLHWQTSYQNLT